MRIAISGAGVAGPTLAYWLHRSGHEVLLIESSPRVREGGYLIDFWGIGYEVADRMGLIPGIREQGYQAQEVRFVDAGGHTRGGFSVDVMARATGGRFTSLRRSDLAATLYRALAGRVEALFGNSITAITETEQGVTIDLQQGPSRQVDLVIGADGLHSRVRELVFGPESDFEFSLGFQVAAFELQGYRPRDELVYVSHGVPGRQLSRFALRDDGTLFLFVFRDEYLPPGSHDTIPEQKALLASVFEDVGWECPRVLAALDSIPEFYFDRVSQIRMDSWSRGRTALIGDAAAAASLLAGEGTGLAMAEAYVLAGELHRSNGDYRLAYSLYQDRMLPFLRRKQASAAGFASSFVPETRLGIIARNLVTHLLGIPPLAEYFVGRELRDDVELPDYGW